jgi:hypothetical protein
MSIEDQEQQSTETKQKHNLDQQPKSSSIVEKEDSKKEDSGEVKQAGPPARRLSVQDRINLFETKQKEVVGSGGKSAVAKSSELKRQPSDASSASAVAEKAVLRRWSGASDMSIDLGAERKDSDTPLCTPLSISVPKTDDKEGFYDTPAPDSKAVSLDMSDGTSEFSTSSVSKSETVDSYSKTSSWPALNKADTSNLKDQATPKVQYRIFSDGTVARLGSETETKFEDSANNYEADSVEKHVASETPTSGQSERADDNRFFRGSNKSYQPPQVEDMEQDEDLGLKVRAAPTSRLRVPTKRTDASQYEGGSGSNSRESQSRGSESADTLSFQSGKKFHEEEDDSLAKKTKFQKQAIPQQMKKPRSKREDSSSVSGNSKMDSEDQDSYGSISVPPVEQGRRTRQSKGNQELNDELTMKANELEKLFAEHKLRVPNDMSTTRRSKATDIPNEESVPQRKRAPDVTPPPPEKNTERQNQNETLKKSLSHIGFSDDSRGKFYESYMQKRDAKLREEWGSKGPEKEAQMKAMQDSLERSKAEMTAKFSLSADRKDSVAGARWRAERLRSFNTRKADQQPSGYVDADDDDDPSEGDGAYKNSQNKKVLPNRTLASSTPRTASALPVPKSISKASTHGARRRMQSDNPLAQSVPNFSDLRKENSKPVSKIARPQLRNYARSRSINEDKPRRSHALGKASAEFKDTESEAVVLTPIKFDIEQSVESKNFLGKNNGVGTTKLKATLGNEEGFIDELEAFGLDDSADRIKEEDEDYEIVDCDGRSRLSQDSEKMINSESENGDDASRQVNHHHSLASELPPGESPLSWISRKNDPFSYTNEASDIDASPMGSPASWNQTDADDAASRMRKKWGSAQKPMLVSNTQSRKDMTKGFKRLLKFGRKSRGTESFVDWVSATTSEGDDDTEDGRDPAYRSSDDLIRKSRMGFSHSEDTFNDTEFYSEQAHSLRSSIPAPPANFKLREDHLSGSSMKAPRSFFSLSTFRSKGSDPKPR